MEPFQNFKLWKGFFFTVNENFQLDYQYSIGFSGQFFIQRSIFV